MEENQENKEDLNNSKEESNEVSHHNQETSLTDKFRENPWVLSTLVLGILALILIVGSFQGITGNVISGTVISGDDAGQAIVDFAKAQGASVELVNVEEDGNFYIVTISMEGQNFPLYVTKDGKFFAPTVTSLAVNSNSNPQNTQQNPQTNVPKSDVPIVELFVMSYCPFGTQAEKGLLPVVALLKDKIDFKLRFVHYTLHGDKEDLENNRELCIREEQSQEVLNKYLVCILDSDNPQAPADLSTCEKEAGVNSAKLQTCLNTKAEDYFASDSELSKKYGVQGSPTLVINGVQSSAGRSPASYLAGICDAFTNAPAECNEQLSTASPSAGFGYNEGTDTVAQC